MVAEDEFANDPEVQYCLLSPEETLVKERIWVNENRDFLRKQQEAVFRKKAEADKPKVTRRRRKKARMGEAQTSPASTPGDAAVSVMKERAFSTRINYDAIRSLFDMPAGDGGEEEKTGEGAEEGGEEVDLDEEDFIGEVEEEVEDVADEEEQYDDEFDDGIDDEY